MTALNCRPQSLVAVASAILLLLTGCAGAPAAEPTRVVGDGFPVEVSSCGFNSTISAAPERAVTMNQGATEVMLALGLEGQMAGTAYLDDAVPEKWQSGYHSVEVLSAKYPDQESLLSVEPDFVYGSYASAFDPDAAGSQPELQELGIGSYLSPFACETNPPRVSFDSVWGEVTDVARAFGVQDRARELQEHQQQQLDDLATRRPGDGLEVFWFDSGDKTAFAGAGEGGPQLILDALGADNLFGDLAGGWADVSWEKVVAADPDVIVLADANWSTAKEKIELLRSDPALNDLRAVRDEAFVVVPFSETTPGVRLADGAVTVAEQLDALS